MKAWLRSNLKQIYLLAILAVMSGSVLMTGFNLDSYDHLGHMASFYHVSEGYLYQFNGASFFGIIQNGLYPPLQDMLLAAIYKVSGGKGLSDIWGIYQLYLVFLLIAFCFLLFMWGKTLNSRKHNSVLFLSLMAIIWFRTPMDLAYQGLSFVDLVTHGLSNQFASWVGLLLFLYVEWTEKSNRFWQIVLGTAIVHTHFVTGMALLIYLFCRWIIFRERIHALELVAIAILSLPLVLVSSIHSQQGAIATVSVGIPILGWICCALINWKDKEIRPMAIAAMILLIPETLSYSLYFFDLLEWITLPAFHYYRFSIYGLVFAIMALVQSTVIIRKCVMVAGLFIVLLQPGREMNSQMITRDILQFDCPKTSWGRIHLFPAERPIDSAFASVCQIQGQRSTIGLYWESDWRNLLISSYVAMIDGYPVLLPSVSKSNLTVVQFNRLLDRWQADLAIEIVSIPANPQVLIENREALPGETNQQKRERIYRLYKWLEKALLVDKMMVKNETYLIYRFQPKEPLQAFNSYVSSTERDKLRLTAIYFKELFNDQ